MNVGGINQGDGYLIGADYLIPGKVGWGQFQPFFRYQNFDNDLTHLGADEYDLGINYVIDGHNAVVSVGYSKNEGGGVADYDRIVAGIQLQF